MVREMLNAADKLYTEASAEPNKAKKFGKAAKSGLLYASAEGFAITGMVVCSFIVLACITYKN